MSNQQSTSYTSYSSASYSSTSKDGEQVSGSRHMQSSYTDPSGTTTKSASQNIGEPAVTDERRYDSQGRETISDTDGGVANRRIEDVSDDQKEKDRQYEERMEDEYAKREGGA